MNSKSTTRNQQLAIGLVQQNCDADRTANLAATISGVRKAAAGGAQLVLLQELHSSHYFCQLEDPGYFDLAESIPGPITEVLGNLASELNVVIIASVFERRPTGVYHNTAVVLEQNGTIAGHYRKMHIPDDPGYHEKFYFSPGDQGFIPINTSVGRLGVLICWDQWYPEAARLIALAGADLLLYPTAIGWDPRDKQAEKKRQHDSWRLIQRAHAVANGLPVVCCNRTGHESDPSGNTAGIQFWGSSFIAGPQGELLAEAPKDESAVLVAEIDRQRSEDVRRIWPFFRDRRIDAYGDLLKRFGR